MAAISFPAKGGGQEVGTIIVITSAPNLAADPDALKMLNDGLRNAEAMVDKPALEYLSHEDFAAASFAWNWDIVDAAADEIAPAVAEMLEAAIAKRLPWVWEPE